MCLAGRDVEKKAFKFYLGVCGGKERKKPNVNNHK